VGKQLLQRIEKAEVLDLAPKENLDQEEDLGLQAKVQEALVQKALDREALVHLPVKKRNIRCSRSIIK
jgi:hypothetical protein